MLRPLNTPITTNRRAFKRVEITDDEPLSSAVEHMEIDIKNMPNQRFTICYIENDKHVDPQRPLVKDEDGFQFHSDDHTARDQLPATQPVIKTYQMPFPTAHASGAPRPQGRNLPTKSSSARTAQNTSRTKASTSAGSSQVLSAITSASTAFTSRAPKALSPRKADTSPGNSELLEVDEFVDITMRDSPPPLSYQATPTPKPAQGSM